MPPPLALGSLPTPGRAPASSGCSPDILFCWWLVGFRKCSALKTGAPVGGRGCGDAPGTCPRGPCGVPGVSGSPGGFCALDTPSVQMRWFWGFFKSWDVVWEPWGCIQPCEPAEVPLPSPTPVWRNLSQFCAGFGPASPCAAHKELSLGLGFLAVAPPWQHPAGWQLLGVDAVCWGQDKHLSGQRAPPRGLFLDKTWRAEGAAWC